MKRLISKRKEIDTAFFSLLFSDKQKEQRERPLSPPPPCTHAIHPLTGLSPTRKAGGPVGAWKLISGVPLSPRWRRLRPSWLPKNDAGSEGRLQECVAISSHPKVKHLSCISYRLARGSEPSVETWRREVHARFQDKRSLSMIELLAWYEAENKPIMPIANAGIFPSAACPPCLLRLITRPSIRDVLAILGVSKARRHGMEWHCMWQYRYFPRNRQRDSIFGCLHPCHASRIRLPPTTTTTGCGKKNKKQQTVEGEGVALILFNTP
ncbi:hypothetical protein B0T10DRAFT_38989 [Thelonectria olida]|uniref:Uncharacterized protein n=1 Tax=Thelonectria olida TaxID=1576542 RepID=A0A9P9APF9_9HYPO|nr:hypothetical protein B0T10DRAFT_38989 [Thelonectria olida]